MVSGLSVAAAVLLLVAVGQAVRGLARTVLSLLVRALVALRQLRARVVLRPLSERRLVGVVDARRLRQSVQLVHLRPRRLHDHKLVLGNVRGGRGQVGDGLGLDALEVHVAALPFLLLPGHADERSLDVVVDDLGATSRTPLHLLFIGWVAWRKQDNKS